jgi:hypothetical protein
VTDEKQKQKVGYAAPRLFPLNQAHPGQGEVAETICEMCAAGNIYRMACGTGSCADECGAGVAVIYCHNGLGAHGSGCYNGSGASGHACTAGQYVSPGCVQGGSEV